MSIKHLLLGIALFTFEIANIQADNDSKKSSYLSYESKYISIGEHRMHFIEKGADKKTVFLFIHGNPSSSYLWRDVMPFIEPLGRVIAVDLIGFGKSDKPDIEYTFQDHFYYLSTFISQLKLKDVTLVIHDWGSVLGLEYARTHKTNVKGIALMEALIPPRFPIDSYDSFGPSAKILKNFRDPVIGKKLIIEDNILIEQILNNGAYTRKLTEEEKNIYRFPFLNKNDREPIRKWLTELPVEGKPARNDELIKNIGEWLKVSSIPKLLLFASPGALITPEEAGWIQTNYKNIESVYIGKGMHYIQEDQPDAIGRNIYSWYKRTFLKPVSE